MSKENKKVFNKYKAESDIIIKSYDDAKYYEDYFITNILGKHIDKQADIDAQQVNFVKFINFVADNLSTMYNEPVIRTTNYPDNKEVNDLLDIASSAADKILNNVDVYTKIGGMTAVKAHWDDYDSNPKNHKFEYVLYTAQMLDYTPRENDYSKLNELYLEFINDGHKIEESWTSEKYSNLINGDKYKSVENPYKFIPFAIFRNEDTPNSWFCAPDSALLTVQNDLSNMMTQFNNIFKYQAMSMLVVKGGGKLTSLKIGASAVNRIGIDEEMDFITPETNMPELFTVLTEKTKFYSRNSNIPDSLISATSTSSGVSIIASQRMLDEYVKERAKQFREAEEEMILNGMKVIAYHKGITLPEDLKINLNHIAANSITKLTKEERENWDWYIDNNFLTYVDVIKKMSPNLSDEEALVKYKENIKINEDLNKEEEEIDNNLNNENKE